MRNNIIGKLITGIILVTQLSCSVKERAINLWPEGKIPNQKSTTVEEIHEPEGILKISKVQNPTIEVFLPNKSVATGQALIIFPGGGYGILAYDWEGTDVAKFLNKRGIAGIVVKYRLPSDQTQTNKHTVPLIDAQRAIRMVKSRAKEWNLNQGKIGIIGFSAGGHLASTLGTKYDEKVYAPIDAIDTLSARPDFMALLYPVITMGDKTHKGSRDNLLGKNANLELINKYSSQHNISENTPPTYLVHAKDDAVVSVANSEFFYALHNVNAKTNCELYLFENGGHGFSLAQNNPILKKWPINLIEWINGLETK